MRENQDFTKGPIVKKLRIFMLPILGALALQVLYGAVDMAIVGRFSTTQATSGVAMGSQVISYVTYMIAGMSTATTVVLGRFIGEKRTKEAGNVIGASIFFFLFVTIASTILFCAFARQFLTLINMPEEAMQEGINYTVICGAGGIFITAYNLLGAIFRGVGDSKTPLITVAIACVINIGADLALVWGLNLGAMGAAIATVGAQAISVLISLLITVGRAKKGALPIEFNRKNFAPHWRLMGQIIKLAIPLAFNELILSASFLFLSAILNTLGVAASAAIGISGKVQSFLMIFTSAFSQSLAAFVAQNIGAGDMKRARKAWLTGSAIAGGFGLLMLALIYAVGPFIAGIFTVDPNVISLSADFTLAYAIDLVFSSLMFCTCGFLNGCGKTNLTLAQCAIGVVIRIPMAYLLMNISSGSMFVTGLCVPVSTVGQLIFLLIVLGITNKKMDRAAA